MVINVLYILLMDNRMIEMFLIYVKRKINLKYWFILDIFFNICR